MRKNIAAGWRGVFMGAGLSIVGAVRGQGEREIRVSDTLRQQMTYGMDFERLWHFEGLEDLDELARVAVGECKVEYVRIAIDGAAEREEGQINWEVYERQLEIMRALRRANPTVKFFAVPRPFHVAAPGAPYTPFPLWITEFEPAPSKDGRQRFVRFHPDKAAGYLVRFLRFMKEQGFEIAYLDSKNECCRFLRPAPIAEMIGRVRAEMGVEMPKVIAPSSYHWRQGAEWLHEAAENGLTDFFDIAASHNTRDVGSPEEFVEAARPFGCPIWNTELHGFQGPDEEAAVRSEILFRHIRAGFGGLNDWLTLGNERKTHKMLRNIEGTLEVMRTYYIFKQLVNTSGGGHYLDTSVPDGLTTTAAFARDDLLTVWVLNAGEREVPEVVIRFSGHAPGGEVGILWWGPENSRQGSASQAAMSEDGAFRHAIAARTLYCFTFYRMAENR